MESPHDQIGEHQKKAYFDSNISRFGKGGVQRGVQIPIQPTRRAQGWNLNLKEGVYRFVMGHRNPRGGARLTKKNTDGCNETPSR